MGVDSSVYKSQSGKQISVLEAYLETALRPVSPRKVFIEDLRQILPRDAQACILELNAQLLAVGLRL